MLCLGDSLVADKWIVEMCRGGLALCLCMVKWKEVPNMRKEPPI
jgi:hypothetical protein